MRIPIQAALTWPDRTKWLGKPVDLADVGTIEFEPLDVDRFPAVGLAYRAGRLGATHPAALNAANEEAVEAFLGDRIGFTDIPVVIERVLDDHDPLDAYDLESVLEADEWARARAAEIMNEMKDNKAMKKMTAMTKGSSS
jgi:1-deoxy-D-xylulose-5-phosphate reductoisomerase